MALSRRGAGTSSSSLWLSTRPSRQGDPWVFAALTPASLCSQGSAAARLAMWGRRELPSPTTCPGYCQISHLSMHSSQGCSDKPCSPVELGELSLGLLLRWLTGRAVPFSGSEGAASPGLGTRRDACLSGKHWPCFVIF